MGNSFRFNGTSKIVLSSHKKKKKIQFGQHFSNKEGVQKDKWKIRLPKKNHTNPLLMSGVDYTSVFLGLLKLDTFCNYFLINAVYF